MFPENLINGFNLLQQSQLVQHGDLSRGSLTEFSQILNNAQATQEHRAVHDVVQLLYTTNRRGYVQCVRNTTNECSLLWTDARAIVNLFDLTKIVFLKQKVYENGDIVYRVHAFADRTGAPYQKVERSDRAGAPYQKAPRDNHARSKAVDLELAEFPVIQDNELVLPTLA